MSTPTTTTATAKRDATPLDAPEADTLDGDEFIAASDNGFFAWKQQARLSAQSESEKGDKFEEMMVRFLTSHPQFSERFSQVMLWDEWIASLPESERPQYSRQDLGIDLIARESGTDSYYEEGDLCAVQCKFYADHAKLEKRQIDAFLAALGGKEFSSGILCHTAAELSKNVWSAFSRQAKSVLVLDTETFRDELFSWSGYDAPAQISYRAEAHEMRPHQRDAKAAWDGCGDGKARITLPCGSGKTLLACRIAEDNARTLVLVPSISLIAQSIREFSRERKTARHSYLAVCSDKSVGQTEDKQRFYELPVPATTDAQKLCDAMSAADISEGVTNVVFATYQSIAVVREAQRLGAPAFDVVIADEAHRTTGLAEEAGSETESSAFKRICEPDYIAHGRKLFMTATPIIFADSEADKASKHGKQLYTMSDEDVYGREIFNYSFAQAIKDGVLCDYDIMVAAVEPDLYRQMSSSDEYFAYETADGKDGQIPAKETTLILALLEAINQRDIKSAIMFSGLIKNSKKYVEAVPYITQRYDQAHADTPDLDVEIRHVDGTDSAAHRAQQLRWLAADDNKKKILSNAQCLSEGVDVPALDAVVFLTPKSSVRECIQAVGRVMRRAEGKERGVVIIPVVAIAGEGTESVDDLLLKEQSHRVLISVVQALRSHDDRLNAELNKGVIDRFSFEVAGERVSGADVVGDKAEQLALNLKSLSFRVASSVSLFLIDNLSSTRYWENWAHDIAATYKQLERVIRKAAKADENADLRAAFRDELNELTGQKLNEQDFIALLASHTITVPLFEAIYPDYDILNNSAAAAGIHNFLTKLAGEEIEAEILKLAPIIDGITERAEGIKTPAKRAEMTKSIYEKLLFEIMFDKAISKGVGYSPIPVVDFLIRSSDDLMRKHFGKGITDENVVVYEPFAGTSSFISRMIGMENLIDGKDLRRKYEHEIYTQELLIMPYYAGDLAVEESFLARTGDRRNFTNSIFGDTFAAHERNRLFDPNSFAAFDANDTRASNELREKAVTLFISNPPFTAGKRTAEEGAANVTYKKIETAMDATYGRQKGQSVKSQWAKAVRFATDRIDDEAGGVISYVIPSTWLRTRSARGFRQSVTEEFDAIYVLDCLGDTYAKGEDAKRQGGSVIGGDGLRGATIPVGLCVFIRLPAEQRNGKCEIWHKEIGAGLTVTEKHNWLKTVNSMAEIDEWKKLTSDQRHDWFDKIDSAYETELIELGNAETKLGNDETAIFHLYSLGAQTGEDERAVNSSRKILRPLIESAADEWNKMVATGERWEPEHFRNNVQVKARIKTGHSIPLYDDERIRSVWYRPFFWQSTRFHSFQDVSLYKIPSLYPKSFSENLTFAPAKNGVSMMMMMMGEYIHNAGGRNCYALYSYDEATGERLDNITDYALTLFQSHYADTNIAKEDIFYYVYGSLNRATYRNKWSSSLKSKNLKHLRIELLSDFWHQATRGRTLAEASRLLDFRLPKPLTLPVLSFSNNAFSIGAAKMKADRKQGTLVINGTTTVSGLPDELWEWEYNGRSIIWWLANRWRKTTGKLHNVPNNPNDLFDDPQCQVEHFGEWLERCAQFARIAVRIDRELDDNGVVDVDVPLPAVSSV